MKQGRVWVLGVFFIIGVPQTMLGQELASGIIPEPVSHQKRSGHFRLAGEKIRISVAGDQSFYEWLTPFLSAFFDDYFVETTVQKNTEPVAAGTADMLIRIGDGNGIPPEGYSLDIQPRHIKLSAADKAGVFYAFQTLRQWTDDVEGTEKGKWEVPCGYTVDFPSYAYRGMHLDVSRHFFDTAFVKRYIDYLARYKLNVFHWHLTDSHGWRIAINKYPRLTSIGAWRADRSGIPFTIAEPTGLDEEPGYGGFYTQREIKEIIAYAAERFVTVVPEIEMPGHCTAALVAYPEYACEGGPPLRIPCGYPGDLQHNFCVGNDSTFVFLEGVLQEVMDLFPGKYIHIGGDEVRKEPWLNCARCQRRMRTEGLEDTPGLQAWFTHRIDSMVSAYGKQLIGWDEILEAGISPNATVMSWRGESGGIEGAKKQHDVIMVPYRNTYFDLYQSDPALEPAISYAPVWLPTVYAFEPTPAVLVKDERKFILGGQACLWTENISTASHAEYMLFPRMLALAEVLWSPKDTRSYKRFVGEVERQFRWFQRHGINYATSMYHVAFGLRSDSLQKAIAMELSNQTGNDDIRFTTDGSMPDSRSQRYTVPLLLKESGIVRAATFRGDSLLGRVNSDSVTLHKGIHCEITADNKTLVDVNRLVDGLYGTIEPYDGRWLALPDSSCTLLVDLGEVKPIEQIQLHFMEDQVGQVFLPGQVVISTSSDGQHFDEIYKKTYAQLPLDKLRHIWKHQVVTDPKDTRYIRLVIAPSQPAKSERKIFLDEIIAL